MKNIPLVTVYIISYEKFEFLYHSIDSVLKQDYPNIELLIFDDSSKDFPLRNLKQYIDFHKHENIKKVILKSHEKNLGTVKNVNEMLKCATGRYFIGLSSDDLFYTNETVSQIVKRMVEKNENLIVTSRVRVDRNTLEKIDVMPAKFFLKKIMKLNTSRKQNKAFLKEFYYDLGSGSSMFFTKDLIEKNGFFDEKYRLWEDGPYLYNFTKKGNKISYQYDIISKLYRDGGVSKQKNSTLVKDHLLFYEKELISDSIEHDFFTKRLVMFNYRRILHRKENRIKKIFFYISNIDSLIRVVCYKLQYKFAYYIEKRR